MLEFPVAPQPARAQPLARPPQPERPLRQAHLRGQAQAQPRLGLPHQQQQLHAALRPLPLHVAHRQRHRARLKQVEHTPPHRQAVKVTSAKTERHQAEGHAARPILDRHPKGSDRSRSDPTHVKARLGRMSHAPTLNSLRTNQHPAQKPREHIIARNQANAKRAVLPSNPSNDNKRSAFSNGPASITSCGAVSCRLRSAYAGWPSTAAVSAGRYFTPSNQTRPERKMIPDTNRNATCMFV